MKYLKQNGPRGRFLYFQEVDGKKKMISVKDIPTEILDKMVIGEPISDEPVEVPVSQERKCIFCGINATDTRLINLQTVALCEEHYLNRTVGEIVQQLRENQ
jgi:hypothetical protein